MFSSKMEFMSQQNVLFAFGKCGYVKFKAKCKTSLIRIVIFANIMHFLSRNFHQSVPLKSIEGK